MLKVKINCVINDGLRNKFCHRNGENREYEDVLHTREALAQKSNYIYIISIKLITNITK